MAGGTSPRPHQGPSTQWQCRPCHLGDTPVYGGRQDQTVQGTSVHIYRHVLDVLTYLERLAM